MVRWGMPSTKQAIYKAAIKRADKLRAKGKELISNELLRMEPDGGTTHVRNTSSSHWRPCLGVGRRCVVPLTSFSEFTTAQGKMCGSSSCRIGRWRISPESGRRNGPRRGRSRRRHRRRTFSPS
jgi:putative SOS response-associated peptidase YedK